MGDTNISDHSIREATGRGWRSWWKILGAWGAARSRHAEIAQFLADEHGLSGWWSQMVTVHYEREHDLREVGETAHGFQMGAHKSLLPSASAAWDLLISPRGLEVWLGRDTTSFHHEKLPDAAAREAMAEHWKDVLEELANLAAGDPDATA